MIGDIEKKISYKFKDKNLLSTALTHSSYAGQFNKKSNERLEFIGDGFLDAVIGFDLFVRLTDNSEEKSPDRLFREPCRNWFKTWN